MPSPMRVRWRPGRSRKFSPTVAEMADMSPMCSIMAATAMGAMTRMEVTSTLAIEPVKSVKKGCRPIGAAAVTAEKSIRGITEPEASTAVAPRALAATATR